MIKTITLRLGSVGAFFLGAVALFSSNLGHPASAADVLLPLDLRRSRWVAKSVDASTLRSTTTCSC